jgi:hypothetical protein
VSRDRSAKGREKSRPKRITTEPQGISSNYVKCPTCPKHRPDEEPCVISDHPDAVHVGGKFQCRWCYGIEWGNEYRKTHGRIKGKKFQAPRAKAKVRKGVRK